MNKVYWLILACIATIAAQGQQTCGTDHAMQQMMLKNPQAKANHEALELYTANFVPEKSGTKRIIPTVVHIIHNGGNENISKEQVLDALRILNEDFQLLNSDTNLVIAQFKPIVGTVNFEFRLAQLDPDGNCTDGITRTQTELTFNADDNVKDLISWPNNDYFNIWVVDQISFGAGGYAYLPGTANDPYDGVVVLNSQFGSIGTSGGSNFSARTLTHEAGHWFNLNHPWGGNNDCGSSCGSDGVQDTPQTLGSCQNCDLSQNDCGPVANVQNYMDYATCSRMFTAGQANRMIAAASSPLGGRNNLWATNNLIATGVADGFAVQPCIPIPDFMADEITICAGQSVEFTNLSYNINIESAAVYNWQFEGGTPATSTDVNPVITYSQPGAYTVTLVTSANGVNGSNSIEKTAYIRVLPGVGEFMAPLTEGFEDSGFPTSLNNDNLEWFYLSGSTQNGWTRNTAASASGNASLSINAKNFNEGEKFSLISPVTNLSDFNSPPINLIFKIAYQPQQGTNDALRVSVSENCGDTWTPRYAKNGPQLSTAGTGNGSFVPNADQWRTEQVNLNSSFNADNLLIRFEFTANNGGILYLDDINLVNSAVSVNEATETFGITIMPNPSNGDATVSIEPYKTGETTLALTDITGRLLGSANLTLQAGNDQNIALSTIAQNIPNGVYMLTVRQGSIQTIKKVVIN